MTCRNIDGSGAGSFALPNVVTFSANDTYTSPAGVDYLEVYAIGGGGGGGGASGVTTSQGCGGGAGGVSFKYFTPGTYAITIGAGGAGNTGTGAGTAGGATDFGGGALIANGGAGGSGGGSGLPRRGGLAGAAHVTATYSLVAEPGQPGTLERSGAGGSNYFGNGGWGTAGTSSTSGSAGAGFGGGGSGGLLTGATNGNGADGGVIIIEHY